MYFRAAEITGQDLKTSYFCKTENSNTPSMHQALAPSSAKRLQPISFKPARQDTLYSPLKHSGTCPWACPRCDGRAARMASSRPAPADTAIHGMASFAIAAHNSGRCRADPAAAATCASLKGLDSHDLQWEHGRDRPTWRLK